ncbi:MAG: hypothetical protein HQL65_20205 [Magnetococcales bacterium]|nr:hypothetical protein [Magnetococcales bacterium]
MIKKKYPGTLKNGTILPAFVVRFCQLSFPETGQRKSGDISKIFIQIMGLTSKMDRPSKSLPRYSSGLHSPEAYRSAKTLPNRDTAASQGKPVPIHARSPVNKIKPNLQSYPIFLTFLVTLSISISAAWSKKPLSLEEGILGLCIIGVTFHGSSKWFFSANKSMPFIELYTFVVGIYYGFPMILGINSTFGVFYVDEENRIRTGIVVLSSVIITLFTYSFAKRSRLSDISKSVKLIPKDTAINIFTFLLTMSTIYNGLFMVGIPQQYLGNFLATFNTILVNVIGTVSSYVLFRLMGEGHLSKAQTTFTIILVLIGGVIIISGLMLVNVVLWILPSILGFTLGRGRIPLGVVILLLFILTFLSMGKGATRNIYWGSGVTSFSDAFQRLSHWAEISMETFQDTSSTTQSLIIDRLNFSGVLGMVIQRTPNEVPYVGGTTYAMLPSMIIPRFLWPDKPDGHAATIFLGLHYGVHARDQAILTSIGIGLLGEAYANFGVPGVIVFSWLLGWILGFAHRMDTHAPPLSMRSFVFVVLLNSITKIEFALVEIIIPLVQIYFLLFIVYGWLFVKEARRSPRHNIPGSDQHVSLQSNSRLIHAGRNPGFHQSRRPNQ